MTSATGQVPAPVMSEQEQAAEAELIALTAPLAQAATPAIAQAEARAYLACAALLTAYGGGLRLLAGPGMDKAAGGACAALAAGWVIAQASSLAARRRHPAPQPPAGPPPPPPWVNAATTYHRWVQRWAAPATLAAADRYLPALGAGPAPACLYVHRCAGPGHHTRLCTSVGIWNPGGQVMLIVGEHPAAHPTVAAVSIAHELRHLSRPLTTATRLLTTATTTSGWGWVTAGAAWAISGWPWPALPALAAGFHLLATAGQWATECACDHGRTATLTALAFYATQKTTTATPRPWHQRILPALTATTHPPTASAAPPSASWPAKPPHERPRTPARPPAPPGPLSHPHPGLVGQPAHRPATPPTTHRR